VLYAFKKQIQLRVTRSGGERGKGGATVEGGCGGVAKKGLRGEMWLVSPPPLLPRRRLALPQSWECPTHRKPSNAFFYDNRMSTLPGTAVASSRSISSRSTGQFPRRYVAAEVRRVVDLVNRSCAPSPDPSLGVINDGHHPTPPHRGRPRNRNAASRPTSAYWFDRPAHNPAAHNPAATTVLHQNLERVQGR